MTHARIPDFSQPVPVRSTSARPGRRRLSTDGCYMRGSDQDREADAPETVLPEVVVEPQPVAEILRANVIQVEPLRWGGHGNIVAAAGLALLDLAGVR